LETAMTRRCFVGLIPATIVTALAVRPVDVRQIGTDQEPERRFLRSVEEYVTQRRALERQLAPLRITVDAREIQHAVDARAAAIRRTRASARVGDIFDPGVTRLFRVRIREAFAGRGHDAAELMDEMNEDGACWQRAAINGRFSWATAVATPPYVLAILPALPGELQFRFVGPDLVLVDTVANFIIDVLPNALDMRPEHGLR
jgi:hypothetical protein